ncbi:MAG: acyltransferase [Armatimonadetes bacterium]|nr:acyltransferase [Armatimonadota bacterium]
MKRIYLNNFDYMRLFLAAEVVYLHLVEAATGATNVYLPIKPVPSFLALSGFMVLGSWHNSRSAGHFWRKRFLRVYPAFFAALALVAFLFGLPGVRDALETYITLGYHAHRAPNGPLWSLGNEEICYLGLTGLAFIGAYKKAYWIWPLAAISYVLTVRVYKDPFWVQETELLVAFFIGNLAYLHQQFLRKFALPVAGVMVVALWLIPPFQSVAIYYLTFCFKMVFMLALALGPQIPFRLPIDLSYGIYIYHFPILSLFIELGSPPAQLVPLTIVGTLGISIASWFMIEKRALALKDGPRPTKPDQSETPLVAPN